MGKKIEALKYRRLRKGTVIKDGDECQLIDDPDDPWEETGAVGLKVGHGFYTENCRYRRPIAKPAPKAKWAPYAPALSTKETKRSLYLKLEEMVATINNLGAENARLKNQLAKLKGAKA